MGRAERRVVRGRGGMTMRVALLTTFHQRCGVATYAESLVSALQATGECDVSIFAPHLPPGDEPIGDQPPRLWNRNRAFGFEAVRVVRALTAAGCEVVHANVNLSLFSSRFLFTLTQLLRRKRIPLVVTFHGRDGGSLGRRFKVWRLYRAVRGAEIVVHNELHARELIAHGHTRVHVVPHGMPPVERRPLEEARAAIGLHPTRPMLAHFGFLVPDKGVLEVLRAFAQLRASRLPDLYYWISGALYNSDESRSYFAALKAEIARLGVAEHVHLTGEFVSHDEAMAAMQAASWIVLNYRTGNAQGASGAISRAFGSGRPVAVSAARVFDDVREATHTLEGDDLADAIAAALESPELAARTVARAEDYCARASWPRVAERHVELYRRAIAGRAEGA